MKISRDTTGKGRDGGSRMRVRGMSARGCQPRGSRAYHVSFVAALVLVHSVFMVFGTGPWTVGATKEAGRRRSSSRAVSVSMHAPWPTLPLSPALETSEYFAEASQASFWEFSRRITEALSKIHGKVDGSGNSNAHLTGDTVLAHSLIVSRGMAPPLFHKVLEVSLDTRAFAPAVEAQHQVSLAALEQVEGRCSEQFANGDAWAVISWPGVPVEANGHPVPVCVASGLESALEHAKPVQRLPSSASASATDESRRVTTSISRHDHVFPASVPVEMGAPTVFLYGLIGTQSFLSFHNLLEGLVAKGSVTYVYRHAPSPSSSENASLRTYLRGFGVTLDLKSMEYKALDDRALGGDEDEDEDDNDESKYLDEASTSSAAEIPEEEEIFGIFFKRLLQRHPNLDDPLRSFRETLMVEQKEGVGSNPGDMKVWDMKDLGLQAAQIICNAKDPLKHLGEISQNFPLYARRLIGVPVKEKLRRQAGSVSRVMEGARSGAGSNSVLFNGLSIDAASDGFNIFELLTKILGEASTQARFAHLGLPSNVMSKVKEAAENPGPRFGSELNAMIGLRVDTRSGSKGRIYYLNNLEKDKAYKRWPKQVANLMQPAYQLFAVRKNLYTGVFVLDPTTKVGLHAIRSMFRIKDMNIPLRFGLAMVPSDVHARTAEDTESANADHVKVADIVRLLAAAKKKSGTGAANLFLAELSKIESFPIKREVAIAAFASAMKSETGTWSGSGHVELAESTLQSNEYMKVPGKVEEYVRAKGLSVNSYAINGKVYDSVGSLEQDLMQVIFAEQQRVQQLVQRGLIRDKTNAYAFFTGTSKKKTKKTSFSSEFAFSHYDSRILGEDSDSEFLPLVSAGGTEENKDVENSAAKPHSLLLDAFRQSEVPYFTSRDIEETAETAEEENVEKSSKDRKGSLVPVTHWVVADLCTEYGLSVAAAAVERLDGSEGAVRVALFHRGEQKTTADGACLKSDAVNGALGPKVTEILTSNSKSPAFFISALSSVLPRDAKGPVVVTNGRLIRLGVSSYDPSNLPFSRDSFLLVEKYESIRIVNKLHRTLRRASSSYKSATSVGDVANDDEAVNQGSGVMSPHEMIMRINSLVSQQSKSSRRKPAIKPEKAKKRFDAISFSSEGTREDMQVVAVVDPLSVAAQRITPTLLMLRDVFNMSVTVVLNPATDITEFPLKNFYRFVPTRVTGSQNGDSIVDIIGQRSDESNPKSEDKENAASWGSKEASLTKFRRLPKQHILTLKLITPEAWVAMKYKVEDDLDNIRLDDTTMGARRQVNAEFRLNSLLIAGSCNDLTHHKPPNGLQLVLKFMNGEDSTRSTDTLVMQNLGYFQLQAQPGVWTLQLDEGRASELYALAPTDVPLSALEPVEHEKGLPGMALTVRSFADTQTNLRVRKRVGKEKVSLLDKITNEDGSEMKTNDDNADSGLMGYISNIWSTDKKQKQRSLGEDGGEAEDKLDTIHVFSLASGHLYERLLRIMMLSVTKRTSGPVKFWLVENFLSPQFKMTIGEIAKQAGFEVALVTYKWPSWLRRQTEKQRIIWGYKILFLDVLFPLHVPKIITVDADQVVRADLRELWEMDLQGAPYAYTPFCTSRKETLGYQFWRSGYWKDHLGDKPYHISALYVVDLVRFRRMAAGDHLRAVYDQLSRDPNSLSNLDQDLPNYVQNQIPIFSLPTEWLWCASWCSDESKANAKTIDLCNHPETKEPKLDMAKRIISGDLFEESWIELDEIVAGMMKIAKARVKKSSPAIKVNDQGVQGVSKVDVSSEEL